MSLGTENLGRSRREPESVPWRHTRSRHSRRRRDTGDGEGMIHGSQGLPEQFERTVALCEGIRPLEGRQEPIEHCRAFDDGVGHDLIDRDPSLVQDAGDVRQVVAYTGTPKILPSIRSTNRRTQCVDT